MFPDIHQEFQKEIDISYDAVKEMGVLTKEKAKAKFSYLGTAVSRMQSNYEKSGNGEGDETIEDGEEGKEGEMVEIRGGAFRFNWAGGYEPYCLYYWALADKYQFVRAVTQMIDKDMSLDDGRVPSAASSRRQDELEGSSKGRKRKAEEEKRRNDERNLRLENELTKQASETTGSMCFHNLVIMKAELQRMKERKNTYEGEKWALLAQNVCAAHLNWKEGQIEEIKSDIAAQMHEIDTYKKEVESKSKKAAAPATTTTGTVEAPHT